MEYKDLPSYERLPEYHMGSPETRAIVESTTNAALRARDAAEDAEDQLFVGSATWGLELWEKLVDVTPEPGASEEDRRAAVLTKMMGSGTCNAAMIAALAKAVTGYESVVVEQFDKYTFSLSFVAETHDLINVDRKTIERMVEEVKPAHLKFEFRPVTWADVAAVYRTWGGVMATLMTWHEIAMQVVVTRREDV